MNTQNRTLIICAIAGLAMAAVAFISKPVNAASMTFQEGVGGYTHDSTYLRQQKPGNNYNTTTSLLFVGRSRVNKPYSC